MTVVAKQTAEISSEPPVSSRSSEPAPHARRSFVQELLAVAESAEAVDLDSCDLSPETLAAPTAALTTLLVRAIEALADVQAGEQDTFDANVFGDEPGSDAWLVPVEPRPPQKLVADLSFGATLELKLVLRDIAVTRAPEESIVVAERARRKLRRSIRMIIEAARGLGDAPAGPAREHVDLAHLGDLSSALVVRKLYCTFRRSLRRPVDDSPDAVLGAIRYAACALATLVTAPEYVELRASDRSVLRRLRERVLQWARADRAVTKGQQLLEDLWTTAELLRGINQRQELRAHDRALAARLKDGPAGDVSEWLGLIQPLNGRDDKLDGLVEQARGGANAELVAQIVARLSDLE